MASGARSSLPLPAALSFGAWSRRWTTGSLSSPESDRGSRASADCALPCGMSWAGWPLGKSRRRSLPITPSWSPTTSAPCLSLRRVWDDAWPCEAATGRESFAPAGGANRGLISRIRAPGRSGAIASCGLRHMAVRKDKRVLHCYRRLGLLRTRRCERAAAQGDLAERLRLPNRCCRGSNARPSDQDCRIPE